MAIVSNVEYWQSVVLQLETYYEDKLKKQPNKYFCYFPTVFPANPIAGMVPKHLKFFGPKVCNLIVIGQPFGKVGEPGHQTIEWPPEGFDNAKQTLIDGFSQWASYELNFYGDRLIIQKALDADPVGGAKFQELMETCFVKIQEECTAMEAYGWRWRGFIESEVPASDFYELFDQFYSK